MYACLRVYVGARGRPRAAGWCESSSRGWTGGAASERRRRLAWQVAVYGWCVGLSVCRSVVGRRLVVCLSVCRSVVCLLSIGRRLPVFCRLSTSFPLGSS
jgi:hypothetical protein